MLGNPDFRIDWFLPISERYKKRAVPKFGIALFEIRMKQVVLT